MDRPNNHIAPQNNGLIDYKLLLRLQIGEINGVAYANAVANEVENRRLELARQFEEALGRGATVEAQRAQSNKAWVELIHAKELEALRVKDREREVALRTQMAALQKENDNLQIENGALRAQLDEIRMVLNGGQRADMSLQTACRSCAGPSSSAQAAASQPSRRSADAPSSRTRSSASQATSSSQVGKKRTASGKPKNN